MSIWLKKIRLVLFLALLLVLAWQQWVTFQEHEENFEHPLTFFSEHHSKDLITNYEYRYSELKSFFTKPIHISYIGETNESFATGAFNYVMSQYYLSPNILYKSEPVGDTILYNLYDSKQLTTASNYYLNNGWHIVKDFNNGLILLSK